MLIDAASTRPFSSPQRRRIRPLSPGEGLDVRCLARPAIVPSRPTAFEYADLVGYERLCLDWYLTEGRADVRVVEQDGEIIGCLLACLDQRAYATWFRRRAARWLARSLHRLVTGRLRGDARRFVALRIRDALSARQEAAPPPSAAHAHLYVAEHAEVGDIHPPLVAAMDAMVGVAGLPGWYTRIDVPDGVVEPLACDGFRVAHRTHDRTSSWLLGARIQRVTVVRELAGGPRGRPRIDGGGAAGAAMSALPLPGPGRLGDHPLGERRASYAAAARRVSRASSTLSNRREPRVRSSSSAARDVPAIVTSTDAADG